MEERFKIITLDICHITFNECLEAVVKLGLGHLPSYVCFANAHMIVEAYQDKNFKNQVNNATIVTADGKPVASAFKWLHNITQQRIAGMDFFPAILNEINKVSGSVFLYGSTDTVLNQLIKTINYIYPSLKIVGSISPPFRKLTMEELQLDVEKINDSKAQFVMVSLGCPKQEKWMADHSHKINAVLLGIGGAFEVTAGNKKRSPKWMQTQGLEWLYRLLQEPIRLFKRYLITNTLFMLLLARDLGKKVFS